MQLQEIERSVLALIGYDRYSSLSVDTDSEKAADFALLHRCVNIARDEIRIGTIIPAILKHATTISTVAATKQYLIANTDFDIPVKVRYTTSDSEFELEKATPVNLLDKVDKTTTQGTPSVYQIFGSSGAQVYIELYEIPETAGESVDIDYKPVLSDVTNATSEDIIMLKYSLTVIKIAAAYAFQFIKKDMANFDKWLLLGRADFKEINLRETGFDTSPTIKTEPLLVNKRKGRYTI
ncbi:MAG: hypothetical protein FJW63_01855 [Actinobacteria bacterium]|nr:hypothetical protein [Actinomycetota bacterium]